jgi:hypothetical protein
MTMTSPIARTMAEVINPHAVSVMPKASAAGHHVGLASISGLGVIPIRRRAGLRVRLKVEFASG